MKTNITPVEDNKPMNAFSSIANFEASQRMAQVFATSDFVPDSYKGKIGNCLIAMNMANRMGADPIMTMQNLYVVHGTPSWSSKFLIGCFNTCGRFTPISYETNVDKEEDKSKWYCIAKTTIKETGEEVRGTKVTWQMVETEGWSKKNGSKWLTMPEQMFRYRSASFLIRTTAPEISLGFYTKDEVDDGVDTIDVEANEVVEEPKHIESTAKDFCNINEQAEVKQTATGNIFDGIKL